MSKNIGNFSSQEICATSKTIFPLSTMPQKEIEISSIIDAPYVKNDISEEFVLQTIANNSISNDDKISVALEYCAKGNVENSYLYFQLFESKLINIDERTKSWMAMYYATNKHAKPNTIYYLIEQIYHDGGYTNEQILFFYAENPNCDPHLILNILKNPSYSFRKYMCLSLTKRYCQNKNADMSIFLDLIDCSIDASPIMSIVVKSRKCTKEIIKKLINSQNKKLQELGMSHRFGKQYSCFS
jgi:hypothetical protein